MEALELEGVEYTAVRAGETIDVGDPAVSIEVLGPDRRALRRAKPRRVALGRTRSGGTTPATARNGSRALLNAAGRIIYGVRYVSD